MELVVQSQVVTKVSPQGMLTILEARASVISPIVYSDQRFGVVHFKRWLKSAFPRFWHSFARFDGK